MVVSPKDPRSSLPLDIILKWFFFRPLLASKHAAFRLWTPPFEYVQTQESNFLTNQFSGNSCVKIPLSKRPDLLGNWGNSGFFLFEHKICMTFALRRSTQSCWLSGASLASLLKDPLHP